MFLNNHEDGVCLVAHQAKRNKKPVMLLNSTHIENSVVTDECKKTLMISDYNQRKGGVDMFAGPAPREHSGAVPPQMTACAPPSEDYAPKKLIDSRLLECKSRLRTPKLVFTALEFVSKNYFFVIFVNLHRISFKFWDKDLFFLVFTSEFGENRKNFERQPKFVEILRQRLF